MAVASPSSYRKIVVTGDPISDELRGLGVEGDSRPYPDLYWWGDFEACTTGVATGWSGIEALSASAQFDAVETPKRLQNRAGKFTVRPGDKSGTSTGERCEVTLLSGMPGSGDVTDHVYAYQWSTMLDVTYQHTNDWEIYQQIHADSRFGQPPIRLQSNTAKTHWSSRLVTGAFANSTAAANGTSPGVDYEILMMPFQYGVWFDFRFLIKWTADNTGFMIMDMKRDNEAEWERFVNLRNIQTLPTYPGQVGNTTIFQKLGHYRHDVVVGVDNFTNTVYHDGYRIGSSFDDTEYQYQIPSENSAGMWKSATNKHPNGNGANGTISGWTQRNGAVLTVSGATDFVEPVFGNTMIKVDMPGTASTESAELNISLTNGENHCYSAWVWCPAGFRFRIYGVDSTSASLATKSFIGDDAWHRVALPFTPNANQNTGLRIGRTATGAAFTIYVAGAQLETGLYPTAYVESTVANTRSESRIQLNSAIVDETQGWVAFRVRLGHDVDSNTRYLWNRQDNELAEMSLYKQGSRWYFRRESGAGSTLADNGKDIGHIRNQYMTILARWDSAKTGVAIDDQNFNDNVTTQFIPDLVGDNMDVGGLPVDSKIDSDILWAAFGVGLISNTDVDTLFEFGNTVPQTSLLSSMGVTAVWNGDNLYTVDLPSTDVDETDIIIAAPVVGLRTEFAVIHMDLSGNKYGEIAISDFTYGMYLDQPNTINYGIPIGEPLCNILYTNPYMTDFRFMRNNTVAIAGLISETEINLTDLMLQVSGRDWKHYLEKRQFPFNPNDPGEFLFAQVQQDTLDIATSILDIVLGQEGSLDFAYSLGKSGNLSNVRIEPGDSEDIHSKINSLAAENPGFDWIITPNRQILVYVPTKGSVVNFPLEKNKNVTDIQLTNLGIRASHVVGFGAGTSKKLGVLLTNPLVPRRYDYSSDYGEIIDKDALARLAYRDLARYANQALQISVTCDKDLTDDFFSTVTLGDCVPVRGDIQGYVEVDDYYRITAIEGNVNGQGDEVLTLTMDVRDD